MLDPYGKDLFRIRGSAPVSIRGGDGGLSTAQHGDEGPTLVRGTSVAKRLPRPARHRVIETGRLERSLAYIEHVDEIAPGLADVKSSRSKHKYRVALAAEEPCECEDRWWVGVMCVHEIAYRLYRREAVAVNALVENYARRIRNNREAGIGEDAA